MFSFSSKQKWITSRLDVLWDLLWASLSIVTPLTRLVFSERHITSDYLRFVITMTCVFTEITSDTAATVMTALIFSSTRCICIIIINKCREIQNLWFRDIHGAYFPHPEHPISCNVSNNELMWAQTNFDILHWPLLLTWISINPSMDK